MLHSFPTYSPARPLSALAAFALASSAFLPEYASSLEPRTGPLVACALLMGFGYGSLYVISMHISQTWAPNTPGTATGAVITASGVGSLIFVRFNTALVASQGSIPDAMRVSAVIATLLAALAAVGLSEPPVAGTMESARDACSKSDDQLPCNQISETEGDSYDADGAAHISAAEMLSSQSFWILLGSICAMVGPGFGVVLSGSRMQTVLIGVPSPAADARFFFITLVGVAGRFVVGVTVDLYSNFLSKRGGGIGAGLRSAKTVTFLLLIGQTAALILARVFVVYRAPHAFAAALAMIYFSFSGGAVVTGCLCKALYPSASTLAFALLGTSVGLGDALFSAVVASCTRSGDIHFARSSEYDLFFVVAGVLSTSGSFASLFIRKLKKAEYAQCEGRITDLADRHKKYGSVQNT